MKPPTRQLRPWLQWALALLLLACGIAVLALLASWTAPRSHSPLPHYPYR